jgi:hypothetical protein
MRSATPGWQPKETGCFPGFEQRDATTRWRLRDYSSPVVRRPLSLVIRDDILDYYGWVFCQGGFGSLHMTFEQFLMVIAELWPSRLHPGRED